MTALLKQLKCIPTDSATQPLALPQDTYFPSVKHVPNLLHVLPAFFDAVPKKFLLGLGVHETVSTKLLLEMAEQQVC